MKSSKRRWTLGEKSLFLTPLLIALGVGALKFKQNAERRASERRALVARNSGGPRYLKTSPKNFLAYMRLSADGNVLAASGNGNGTSSRGTIYLWNAQTLKSLPPIPPTWTSYFVSNKWVSAPYPSGGITLSPDGQRIAFSPVHGQFKVLNLKSRRKLWENKLVVEEADFSPDGKYLAVSSDKQVTILNATNGKIIKSWSKSSYGHEKEVLWSPDSQLVASIGDIKVADNGFSLLEGHGGKIELHDSQGKKVQVLGSDFTTSFNFSPDGKKLICVGEIFDLKRSDVHFGTNILAQINFLRCFDLASGALQWERISDGGHQKYDMYRDALFSPDGKTLAVHAISAHQILLLNAKSGREIRRLPIRFSDNTISSFSQSLAFSPDGKRLFARDNYSVLVWDLTDGVRSHSAPQKP